MGDITPSEVNDMWEGLNGNRDDLTYPEYMCAVHELVDASRECGADENYIASHVMDATGDGWY